MKSTGIVRRIDDLGRIVIPVELRHMLDIKTGDDLEIWREDGAIAVCRYASACLFCGGVEGLERYKGKLICRDCVDRLIALGAP